MAVHHSFVAALGEYQGEGRLLGLDPIELADRKAFRAYVATRRAASDRSADRPADRVPETVLWYVDRASFIGHLSIRHELNEWLFEVGGHIGYDVRPAARRQGHAGAMLAASLPLARRLGIGPALVTCDSDNVPSRRVIEKCGGVLEDERRGHLRYWIRTSPEQAGVPRVPGTAVK